jgi:hypothetical protein
VILQISPDQRAERLAAIGRTHRGRRARIRVGSGHAPGRTVAELPLVSLRWRADERRLEILLGDPARDIWYPHEVWDVRELDVRTAPDGVDVRMGYPGGHTTLSLSTGTRADAPAPALARSVAVA